MIVRYRLFAALLLLPLAACQRHEADQAAGGAAPVAAAPAAAVPVAPAAATPPATGDVDAMIAENDRVIAQNKRMKQVLATYRQTDSAKLDRLQSSCEQKLGAPADPDGARRIFGCVSAAW